MKQTKTMIGNFEVESFGNCKDSLWVDVDGCLLHLFKYGDGSVEIGQYGNKDVVLRGDIGFVSLKIREGVQE